MLVTVALVLGYLLIHEKEGAHLAAAIEQAEPVWLLAGLAVLALRYLCAGRVWQLALRKLGVRLPWKTLTRLAVERIYFDQLIPAAGLGGSAMNIRTLNRRGIAATKTTTAFLADIISNYLAYGLCAVASLAILWNHHDLNHLVAVTAALFSGILLAVPSGVLWLLHHHRWRLPKRLARYRGLRNAARLLHGLRPGAVTAPLLARLSVWQLAIYVLDALTLGLVLIATGHRLGASTVFACFVVASMAGTLAIIPGGLGTFDAALIAMLKLLGLTLHSAVGADLLFRGFTLWLPMFPGAFFARHHFQRE
jgi:uncharacterized protein (TIRG00374 family)